MGKNIFNSVSLLKPKKNKFDLSHDVKLSGNMGDLIPVMCMETVPGDKVHLSAEALVRLAPLVSPVMHRMDVSIHYFFVPSRLCWQNWSEWIAGNKFLGPPVGVYIPPYMEIDHTMYNSSRLFDYMGIPDPVGNTLQINAMPFVAYQRIWHEFYRDQNLQEQNFRFPISDGGLTTDEINYFKTLRKRCWEHDYFTAALPWAQKGDSVSLPLGKPYLDPDWVANGNEPYFADSSTNVGISGPVTNNSGGSIGINDGGTPSQHPVAYEPNGSLIQDPVTINDLRRSFRLQEWLERNARAGTRYVENILAHFGVKSSDARLQRPEYITGVKSPIVISEVLNTTGESGGLPQGNMSGHGISVAQGNFGSYFCEEHGYVIGVMSVMPKTAYQQGVPKMFAKFLDRLDYYWPSFANIGEQPVQNQEIYAGSANPIGTFGYVPRYAEYKFMPSRVAGQFKTSLDFWHLGRIFASEPALNEDFVVCNPDTRIFAVTDPTVDHLFVHVLNKVQAIRPMPKFGNPSF